MVVPRLGAVVWRETEGGLRSESWCVVPRGRDSMWVPGERLLHAWPTASGWFWALTHSLGGLWGGVTGLGWKSQKLYQAVSQGEIPNPWKQIMERQHWNAPYHTSLTCSGLLDGLEGWGTKTIVQLLICILTVPLSGWPGETLVTSGKHFFNENSEYC